MGYAEVVHNPRVILNFQSDDIDGCRWLYDEFVKEASSEIYWSDFVDVWTDISFCQCMNSRQRRIYLGMSHLWLSRPYNINLEHASRYYIVACTSPRIFFPAFTS